MLLLRTHLRGNSSQKRRFAWNLSTVIFCLCYSSSPGPCEPDSGQCPSLLVQQARSYYSISSFCKVPLLPFAQEIFCIYHNKPAAIKKMLGKQPRGLVISSARILRQEKKGKKTSPHYTERDITGNFQVESKGWAIPRLCTTTPDNPLTCGTKAGHLASRLLSLCFNPFPLNLPVVISELNFLNFRAFSDSTSAHTCIRKLTLL